MKSIQHGAVGKHEKVIRGGKTYVLVEQGEFKRMLRKTASAEAGPPLPEPDAAGNVPAIAFARASIAREVIARRQAAGLSQTKLAAAAGVRLETLNRIENGRHTADTATLVKIDEALKRAARAPKGVIVTGATAGGRAPALRKVTGSDKIVGSMKLVGKIEPGKLVRFVKVSENVIRVVGVVRKQTNTGGRKRSKQ